MPRAQWQHCSAVWLHRVKVFHLEVPKSPALSNILLGTCWRRSLKRMVGTGERPKRSACRLNGFARDSVGLDGFFCNVSTILETSTLNLLCTLFLMLQQLQSAASE